MKKLPNNRYKNNNIEYKLYEEEDGNGNAQLYFSVLSQTDQFWRKESSNLSTPNFNSELFPEFKVRSRNVPELDLHTVYLLGSSKDPKVKPKLSYIEFNAFDVDDFEKYSTKLGLLLDEWSDWIDKKKSRKEAYSNSIPGLIDFNPIESRYKFKNIEFILEEDGENINFQVLNMNESFRRPDSEPNKIYKCVENEPILVESVSFAQLTNSSNPDSIFLRGSNNRKDNYVDTQKKSVISERMHISEEQLIPKIVMALAEWNEKYEFETIKSE